MINTIIIFALFLIFYAVIVEGEEPKKNNQQKNIVYIAGKITGLSKEEYTKNFNDCETRLIDAGYRVLNPIKIVPEWIEYQSQMDLCKQLVSMSDFIFLQDNWKESSGAIVEAELGIKLKKGFIVSFNVADTNGVVKVIALQRIGHDYASSLVKRKKQY